MTYKKKELTRSSEKVFFSPLQNSFTPHSYKTFLHKEIINFRVVKFISFNFFFFFSRIHKYKPSFSCSVTVVKTKAELHRPHF